MTTTTFREGMGAATGACPAPSLGHAEQITVLCGLGLRVRIPLDRTLLVYCKSAACFWYFDSLSSTSAVPAHARATATKLSPLVSAGSSGTIEVTVRKTPRQANGFDCGVHVLAIAEWLCSNVAGATAGDKTTPATTDLNTIESLTPSAISAKRTAISAIIRSLASM